MIETALVIGANSDIAYDLILNIAKKFKPNLFLLASKNIDLLKQTANDLQIRSQIANQVFQLDLENPMECQNFYKQLPIKPDLVIYCAGYLGDQLKAEYDANEALKILNINYTSAMLMLDAAAIDMSAKKQGTIIAISSVAGLRGRKTIYHYGAAKAALINYLSGLRNRLASDNVQVISVLPGYMNTKMVKHLKLPQALTAQPAQVAEAISNAIGKNTDVIYIKKIWRLIMWVINNIPERIFKRLSL